MVSKSCGYLSLPLSCRPSFSKSSSEICSIEGRAHCLPFFFFGWSFATGSDFAGISFSLSLDLFSGGSGPSFIVYSYSSLSQFFYDQILGTKNLIASETKPKIKISLNDPSKFSICSKTFFRRLAR